MFRPTLKPYCFCASLLTIHCLGGNYYVVHLTTFNDNFISIKLFVTKINSYTAHK